MNYQQFICAVKDQVAQHLGEGMSLQIHTALKNNGKERVGLTVSDKRVNISPTIYLEEYFRQYNEGTSISDIAASVLDVYHEVKFEHTWPVHTVKDFATMKSKIAYKLIHARKNEAFLQKTPHITYLDFAIVFYILFEVDESGTATIPITTELMQLWGVSLEEIQQHAFYNAPTLLPASFKPMQIVINELTGTNYSEEDFTENLMYVLTNNLRSFGASCLLYDGMLPHIGEELAENYYILPSSVHEMIIVPESNSPSRSYLKEMVKDVNRTQVDDEEFLSDCVYYYDRKTDSLS